MNDFTKYELQSLKWAINFVRDRTNNCADVMRRILNKVDDMIDNYCNHNETEIDADGGVSLVCKSCGKTTMDI